MNHKEALVKTSDKEEVQVSTSKPQSAFPFAKENYIFMIAGIVAILLGMLIISLDDTTHGAGFLGLTLGPIVLFLGFMFEIFAILYKKK